MKLKKSRYERKCRECKEIILKGDQYGQKSSIEDPVFKDREERIGRDISAYYDSKKSGDFTGDWFGNLGFFSYIYGWL